MVHEAVNQVICKDGKVLIMEDFKSKESYWNTLICPGEENYGNKFLECDQEKLVHQHVTELIHHLIFI